MDLNYLPALYKASNCLSAKAQSEFYYLFGFSLVFLVIATLLSVFYISDVRFIYLQIIVLVLSLACTGFIGYRLPEKTWYGGRALAESVKTISWRFMARAEPFDGSEDVATLFFLKKLKDLISSNKEITQKAVHLTEGEEITSFMLDIRRSNLERRKEFYLSDRVNDQLAWYRSKAKSNLLKANIFLCLIISLSSIAVFSSVLRISYPTVEHWPTDIFIALITSLLGWNQAKRYRELSASYSQTQHEINLIKQQLKLVATEEEFSLFIGDSENGFSREHTQWIARRDH